MSTHHQSEMHGISARAGEVEFFRLSLGKDKHGKLQIEATQPEETEVLELPGTNLHKSEYPKQLLAKIEEAEAKNYYLNLIENAALQYEGKDLVWWGYNKTHEFLIDRATLDKTDINALKLTENIADKFGGKPKQTVSSTDQKQDQNNAPTAQKLKFQPKTEPTTAVLSWKPETIKFLENTEKPSGLLLMSVFASEIDTIDQYFNENDQVLYHYEPLKLIADGCSNSAVPEKLNYLRELLSCQYRDLSTSLQNLKTRDEKAARFVGKGGITFRYKSDRLCRGEFCDGKDFSKNEEKCMNSCPDVNTGRMTELCTNDKILPTIKVVRVCNLANLEPLFEESRLKAVLMLRDPRAIAFERANGVFKSWNSEQIVTNIKWMCSDMGKSLELAAGDNSPVWLRKRLVVVRAEDILIRENEKWMGHIEKFAHLEKSTSLNWRNVLEKENSTMFDWRSQSLSNFNFQTVKEVERVCGYFMKLAGYKSVGSEEDLKRSDKILF